MTAMAKQIFDWDIIGRAAIAVGMSKENLKKCKQRRHIPPRWWYPISKHLGGAISLEEISADWLPAPTLKKKGK